MATNKPRFTITLEESTLKDVIRYQEEAGFKTRSRAIERLIEIGIAALAEKGLLEKNVSLTRKEKQLLSMLQSFNDYGKTKLFEQAEDMTASGRYTGKHRPSSKSDRAL